MALGSPWGPSSTSRTAVPTCRILRHREIMEHAQDHTADQTWV